MGIYVNRDTEGAAALVCMALPATEAGKSVQNPEAVSTPARMVGFARIGQHVPFFPARK